MSVSISLETSDHEMRTKKNVCNSIKGCWTPFGHYSLCYTQGVNDPWGRINIQNIVSDLQSMTKQEKHRHHTALSKKELLEKMGVILTECRERAAARRHER